MSLTEKLTFFGCIFFCFGSFTVWAQNSNYTLVLCHECWPYMEGVDCANLSTNNTLYNCTNYGVYDLKVTCFSAYINLPGSSAIYSGVYRGCAMRLINYTDYCAFYTDYVASQGISIVSCAECNEDGCNMHQFTEDGQLLTDDENGCSQIGSWSALSLVIFSWFVVGQIELN